MSFKKYDHISRITPNTEVSEGVRPAENFIPAPYLPLVRYDKKLEDYYVVSAGKVVALDSNNYIVPAGLLKDIQTAITAGDVTAAGIVNKYTATDVAEGVKNAAGDFATNGEAVIAAFFPSDDASVSNGKGGAGTPRITVSKPIGIAPYNYFRWNGSGMDGNPMDYTYTNYNMQSGVAVLTRYYIEMPVVSTTNNVVFPGIALFQGSAVPGALVTYDANSNFVPLADISGSADVAALEAAVNKREGTIVGRIYAVDKTWPKDYMDRVMTWNVDGFTTIDKTPGSATSGMPDSLTYSGGDQETVPAVVRINLLV